MTERKAVISLENVCKTYRMGEVDVKALQGVTMKVFEGEFVAIMGPSGSGKSTLMNLVGCLDYPSNGVVRLDGQDIATLDESDLAQVRGRKIGFVFQKFNLINYLSALDNVALPLTFQGAPPEERSEMAVKYLEKAGLGHRLDHLPTQLSGGEQQRVAIARALAGEPQLILADEPTGNLDSKTGEEILELLNELNKEGKTIVMVTHDPHLAAKRAHRIVRIRDGQLEKNA
ncbi:MAG: ABC transporter ATP-binding protein [Candidatus Micrarchaeota archaeon]